MSHTLLDGGQLKSLINIYSQLLCVHNKKKYRQDIAGVQKRVPQMGKHKKIKIGQGKIS